MLKYIGFLVFTVILAGPVALAQLEPVNPLVAETEDSAAGEARTEIGRALDLFLSDEGDELILVPNRLDKNRLDFTMDSLKEIDSWLNSIYTLNSIEAGEGSVGEMFQLDGRGDNSVTFAGLYLGEVVRQNAQHDWVWQPFELFIANNPAHEQYFGADPGFDTYVLVSEQGVATPMNAALRRTMNGPIDSVHYIGTFLSTPVDMSKVFAGGDKTGISADGPVAPGTFLGDPEELNRMIEEQLAEQSQG